ncbi:Os04g0671100 [Oryza sativa Japonica Group]|jgi:hypothetical protein|nr:Os04g0671100 [Oryza sativa Japonica Group]|eukprot:NP_001054217.2 Os04g0671100 [Oryza sativa Japonica Group]
MACLILCANEKLNKGKFTFSLLWHRAVLSKLSFLQCEPVEDFYRARGKLLEFNLPGGIPESWPKLLQALNLDPGNERSAAA